MPPDRCVHFERLHPPGDRPWWVRTLARLLCHAMVRSLLATTTAFQRLRGRRTSVAPGRPARVVLTGTFFADNWVEAHVRPLAAATNCEHVWVVSDRPFVPIENVTYVSAPRWLQRFLGRVPVRSLLFVITALRSRPDFVGGFHLQFNGLLALFVGRMIGARSLWFCVGGPAEFAHGGLHSENSLFNKIGQEDGVLERLLLAVIRRFDLILTMGTKARDDLRYRGVGVPIEVMSGGIDEELFSPHDRPRRYDLITVARMAPIKRIDVFLEVVRRVANVIPKVKAVVVGDGEELANMTRRAHELGLDENVDFVGRRNDVHRWLADARVYVLTSDSEGLTLSLMEAMSAGLPAVVSDVGDLADLVDNGVNGWRVPPGAVEEFVDRITTLLTDGQRYRGFADNARRSAQAHSVPSARDRWTTILKAHGFEASTKPTTSRQSQWRLLRSRKELWERFPTRAKAALGRGLQLVPPQALLGKRFRSNLRFVEEAQHWSRDQAASYQLKALKRIVSLAYQRSPYYRRVFRSLGFEPGDLRCLEDFSKLPTIDAQSIRDHVRSFRTLQRLDRRADYISTGGTGGKPLQFYINADRSSIEYAYLTASWRRIGYRLGMPLAVLRGRVVPEDRTGLRHAYDPLLRHHYYSTFHMTDENMGRYVNHIRGLGKCFLHVYPSSVFALARFLLRSGIDPPRNILGIIAESENVYPEQRRIVEEVFGVRYFSCYGHTEKAVAAAECEHSADYHVWPTYGYFELVDDEGEPVSSPCQRGEIVGTSFINTVIPFIRYRTGDYATYMGDHCLACGRRQTLIRDIRGHNTQEVLIASDGAEVPWSSLNMHDDTFINVRQFQFRQDTPGQAVLRIVPNNGFGNVDRSRILRNLDEKLTGRMAIDVEVTDSIPLSPRGKTIYIDQCI